MPLISTLCLRVLIVGARALLQEKAEKAGRELSLRAQAAVYVLKRCACRMEVTTNIACETVGRALLTRASYANALHGCASACRK